MAWQSRAVLDRLDRGVDRAAGFVAENHDQGSLEHLDRVFEARDHFVACEIAGHTADEQVAARGVEAIFGRDAGVGAAAAPNCRIARRPKAFCGAAACKQHSHMLSLPLNRSLGCSDKRSWQTRRKKTNGTLMRCK